MKQKTMAETDLAYIAEQHRPMNSQSLRLIVSAAAENHYQQRADQVFWRLWGAASRCQLLLVSSVRQGLSYFYSWPCYLPNCVKVC